MFPPITCFKQPRWAGYKNNYHMPFKTFFLICKAWQKYIDVTI